MDRRNFLSAGARSALALGAVQGAARISAEGGSPSAAEYYLLRRYDLTRAEATGCDRYLQIALLPALTRLGYATPGVFALEYGPHTPATYLLVRHTEPAKLLDLDTQLLQDEAYRAAAASFRTAPAAQPSFQRMDDTLLRAFAGHPVLTPPAAGRHTLQLRTYESPSAADHALKVQMFHSGEFEIFAECGMHAVFYAETLVGAGLPSLTYLLDFASLADLEQSWARFHDNPAWKKLSTDPRFSKEDLVSNITNLVLSRKSYSLL